MKKNILSLTVAAAIMLFCGNQAYAYWTDTLGLHCQGSVLYPITFEVMDDIVPIHEPIVGGEEGQQPAEPDGAGDSLDTGGINELLNDPTVDNGTIVDDALTVDMSSAKAAEGDIPPAEGLQEEEAEAPGESNNPETDEPEPAAE